MIISLGMIMTRETSLINAIILASIASRLCTLAFGGENIKEAIQAKKVLKNKKEQFENAKEKEEKDKELKITLANEYARIKQEMLSLKYKLSWLQKQEALQSLGYELEFIISKFKEHYKDLEYGKNKEFYCELWGTYLEEQNYKKIHLYSTEIDTSNTLIMKLPKK